MIPLNPSISITRSLTLAICATLLSFHTAMAASVTIRPAGDGEEKASGKVETADEDLELGYLDGKRLVGLRYDLKIPKGAVIESARLQFKAARASSSKLGLVIRAEDSDDARIINDGVLRDLSKRPLTSASVQWSPKAWRSPGHENADQLSPDLAKVVQEVVSRRGWKQGNSLLLLVATQSGSGARSAMAKEQNSGQAAELTVRYRTTGTAPSGNTGGNNGGNTGGNDNGGGNSGGNSDGDSGGNANNSRGQRVIFDSDFGFDVDDAGALAVLHALADKGEARVLATITEVTDEYSAGAMDAINSYYGRGDVIIGQNKHAHRSWANAYAYWRPRKEAGRYIKSLDQQFSNNTSAGNAMDAVSAYRRALAGAPDDSVNIAAVGFTENLAELLKSDGDRYSPLSGRELVKRKVGELVIMGGSNGGTDFNLNGGPANDPSSSQYVLANWPGRINLQNGRVCGSVNSGNTLKNPGSNPVARAFVDFNGRAGGVRASWDQCVVLQAVRGLDNVFSVMPNRSFSMQGKTGRETTKSVSSQRIIARKISIPAMTALINDLMDNPPKR